MLDLLRNRRSSVHIGNIDVSERGMEKYNRTFGDVPDELSYPEDISTL